MDKAANDALHRLVVEADPNLVFVYGADGEIVHVNSRWIEYTGVTAEQIGKERAAPMNIVHPDDLERTWRMWQASLRSGKPFEISYRLRSVQDGRYRWFVARAVAQRDGKGKILGWYGVATDIDTQVRAADRARFLSEASAALSSTLSRDRMIQALIDVVLARFCDGCVVVLKGEDGALTRVAVRHRDPETTARALEKSARIPVRAASHSARVMETLRSVFMPDVDDEKQTGWQNTDGIQLTRIFEPLRSLITVPMMFAERAIGTLTFVATGDSQRFDVFDVETAEAVARQAAISLEHGALYEREHEAAERFAYLAHATDQLFATRDLGENLETFLQSLVGHWAHRAILFTIGVDGTVRAHAVADASGATANLTDEFRGQRIFVPEAEAQFVGLIARHTSWLRTDVTPQSINMNIQPYLHHVVERLPPHSLLVIPLYTPDFDFGALGVYLDNRNFTENDREMFEELGRRLSIAIEHAQSVSRERRLVRTLQEATLPAMLPSIPGVVLSTSYAASTSSEAPVGGDWYDAFELPSGRTVLSIGDVTGSGLQAAAIMGKIRHTINSIALYENDPARILDAVEYILSQRYPDAVATSFLAIMDTNERRIWFANAGHPHPWVRLWNGNVEKLEAVGLPLGSRTLAPPAESRSRTLEDVAMIAFYTDGVTELTRNVDDGEKRMCEALRTDGILYVRAPATMISDWCIPEGPHDDDAAMMVVSFPHSVGWSFEAENARAAQAARGSFMARLQKEATPESDFAAAEIIFGELVGNVVRHAPGSIDVALEWRDNRAVLHVVDRGPGFEYTLPANIDLLSESGRGLWLAHQFGEQVTVECLPGFGAHVSVVLPVFRQSAKRVNAETKKRAKAALR